MVRANTIRAETGVEPICAGIKGSNVWKTESGTAAATGSAIKARMRQTRRREASRRMPRGTITLTSARPARTAKPLSPSW